jgi:hypothetical protein
MSGIPSDQVLAIMRLRQWAVGRNAPKPPNLDARVATHPRRMERAQRDGRRRPQRE